MKNTLLVKPSLENAFRLANIALIDKALQNNDLDLSLLEPGQILAIQLGKNPPLGMKISFLITRKSGPNEAMPLMGKISGYKMSGNLLDELSRNGVPVPLIGLSCAIIGSCRTNSLALSFANIEKICAFKPNVIFRREKLFLLLRPDAGNSGGREFSLVFPFFLSRWLLSV
jgi:hypothetical protein